VKAGIAGIAIGVTGFKRSTKADVVFKKFSCNSASEARY
jgi:hypothetical protein